MPLESGTYISALNPANPSAVDPASQGDDHLRLIKNTLKQTFPNLTGAMTANQAQLNKMATVTVSAAELNRTSGLTEDLTTTLGGLGTRLTAAETALAGAETTPAGTIVMFAGAVAPTGWHLCDGTALDRTTQATLFAAIGETFGAGDGSTTFNVPNTIDRFPRGAGGTYLLGATHEDSNKDHDHTFSGTGSTNTAGSHTHSYNRREESTYRSESGGAISSGYAYAGSTSSRTTGSSGNHSHTVNVSGTTDTQGASEAAPKGIAFNYIIKL